MKKQEYHAFTTYENLQEQVARFFKEREKLLQSKNEQELSRVDTLYQKLRPQLEVLKPVADCITKGEKNLSGPRMHLTIKSPSNTTLTKVVKIQAISALTICESDQNLNFTPLKDLRYLAELTFVSCPINWKSYTALASLQIAHLTFKKCYRPLSSKEAWESLLKKGPNDQSLNLHLFFRPNPQLQTLTLVQMPAKSDEKALRFAQSYPVHVLFQNDPSIEGQGIRGTLKGRVTYDRCPSFWYLYLDHWNFEKVDVRECPELRTLSIGGPPPKKSWLKTNHNLFSLPPKALTERSWTQTIRKLVLSNQTLSELPTLPKQIAHLVLIYGVGPLDIPTSIQKLTLSKCTIENKDIENLPKTLKKLSIFECPKINLSLERLRTLFKHCVLHGFNRREIKTKDGFSDLKKLPIDVSTICKYLPTDQKFDLTFRKNEAQVAHGPIPDQLLPLILSPQIRSLSLNHISNLLSSTLAGLSSFPVEKLSIHTAEDATDIQFTHKRVSELSLVNCPELTTLVVHCHELRKMTLLRVSQLTFLDLSDCDLESVPEGFATLTALEQLDLSHNNIRRLPRSIGQFKQLKTLLLYDNPLLHLPPELTQCRKLNTLILDIEQLQGQKKTEAILKLKAHKTSLYEDLKKGNETVLLKEMDRPDVINYATAMVRMAIWDVLCEKGELTEFSLQDNGVAFKTFWFKGNLHEVLRAVQWRKIILRGKELTAYIQRFKQGLFKEYFTDDIGSSLNLGEELALYLYTQSRPQEMMNLFLRGLQPKLSNKLKEMKRSPDSIFKEMLTHVAACVSGWNRIPAALLKEGAVTYRLTYESPERIALFMTAITNKTPIQDLGFISTAYKQPSEGYFWKSSNVARIYLDPKNGSKNIEKFSQYKERERLFLPGMREHFESFTTVKDGDDKKYIFRVRYSY